MRTVTRAFLRYLPRRRSLSLLHVAGIACGVAAAIGMIFSARAAMVSFSAAIEYLNGKATHSLESVAGPLDERVLARLAEDPSVRAFAPVIDRKMRFDNGEPVRLLGIDPFLDKAIRPHMLGPAPGGASDIRTETDRGSSFLLDERAVLIDANTAARLHLAAGDTVKTSRGAFKLLGAFPTLSPEPLMVIDIGHAQRLMRLDGRIDRVDLIVGDEAAFLARWGRGFRVQSVRQREQLYAGMLRAFRLNLQALSLIALFVGVFLIYNTATFAVASRRRDAAILLCVGARRGEVGRAFLTEMLIFGVAGGVLGGAGGYLLSRFLTGLVGLTVSNLYFFLKPVPLPWSWWTLAWGALFGTAASVAGSLFPLLELSRLDPVRIMQPKTASRRRTAAVRRIAAVGLAVLALTAALLVMSPMHVYVGFASAFTFLFAASLMTGAVLVRIGPLLKHVFGIAGGLPGRMAAGSIRQNLGRTAVAIAAFMVALSMSVGLGSMIGSFRQSLIWWMDTQLQADLYIGSTSEGIEVPQAFCREIDAIPGIGGIDPYRNAPVAYRGEAITVAAVRAAVLQRYTHFGWLKGANENWDPVKRGEAAVSESFCRNFHVAPGDTIELPGKAGPVPIRIAAAFYDYTTEHGLVMMDWSTYAAVFGDDTVNSLGVFIDPGNPDGPRILDDVRRRAAAAGLPAFSRAEMHGRILSVFDSTFAVTRSMRLLAIVVAFLGVAGALLTLFVERQREFGILRALGFSVGQVAAMTLLEGLAMGVVSLGLAAISGTVLAVILIKVINLQSFNWTIFIYPEWGPYLTAAATALLASGAAALYPVWKVLRTYPHMQLREE